MRDFGFRIYKSFLALPEKPKEDKKKDKDHKVRLIFISNLSAHVSNSSLVKITIDREIRNCSESE